jgi:hypothetical protein
MSNPLTTAPTQLALGSIEVFQPNPTLVGIPWDLTGGSGVLQLRDPTGALHTIIGTIAGNVIQAPWQVASPAGRWSRAWTLSDVHGIVQVSRPIAFDVVVSP